MIEAVDLVKTYNGIKALNRVSFTILENGIYGLLGPNGAGKSTLIRILSGVIYQTSGTVKVFGRSFINDPLEIKRNLGYLPENAPLDEKLKVYDYLYFAASLKGIKGSRRSTEVERVMDLFGLTDSAYRRAGNLSKGFRQRVCLAEAMIGSPVILLLDEPFSGLDPKQIIDARKILLDFAKTAIVIFSTHILQEIKSLCRHTIILSKGEIKSFTRLEDDVSLEEYYLKTIGRITE